MAGRTQTFGPTDGGGVDVPWVVFISQEMPQMPEAGAGARRFPRAAVTNPAPPLLPHSPTSSPTREKEPESVPGKGTRDRGLDSSFSISSIYLPRLDAQTN